MFGYGAAHRVAVSLTTIYTGRIRELEVELDRAHREEAGAVRRLVELATINRIQAATVNGMEAQIAELLPYAQKWAWFVADTDMTDRINSGEFGPWPQEPVVEDPATCGHYDLGRSVRAPITFTGPGGSATYVPLLNGADDCPTLAELAGEQ